MARSDPPSAGDPLREQLARNSSPYADPLARVAWDRLSLEDWWLPPEALSLHGLETFAALPEPRRRALSHYEFLHTVEMGLWLEGLFMERLTRSMRAGRDNLPRLVYHLHELREEAGHSLMFLHLIQHAGLPRPPLRQGGLRLLALLARATPFDSLPFWAAVLIGEEVPDRFNRYLKRHGHGLCPAILDVVRVHMMDEARHVTHALDTLSMHLSGTSARRRRLLRPLLGLLFRRFVDTFYYPAPGLYELAGLSPGKAWARAARTNPVRRAFVRAQTESLRQLLARYGVSPD